MSFYRLQSSPCGDKILARIFGECAEVVDIFVTRIPQGRRQRKCCLPVRPPDHWLSKNGFPTDIDIASTPDPVVPAQQIPSWYLVRQEMRLSAVCKIFNKIISSSGLVNLNTAPCRVLRIAASILQTLPDFYMIAHRYSYHANNRYDTLQIIFDQPEITNSLLIPLTTRALFPANFAHVDFRFLPARGQVDIAYIFNPRSFLLDRGLSRTLTVAINLPFLSSRSPGCSVQAIKRTPETGSFTVAASFVQIGVESWSTSSLDRIPSTIVELAGAFSAPPYHPYSLSITLPHHERRHNELIRAWKYANCKKRESPAMLTSKHLSLFNITKDSFDHFMFLANFVPAEITHLAITPLQARPSFHSGYNKRDLSWRRKEWTNANVSTDIDLSVFNVNRWHRDSSGLRIRAAANDKTAASYLELKDDGLPSPPRKRARAIKVKPNETGVGTMIRTPGYVPMNWQDVQSAYKARGFFDPSDPAGRAIPASGDEEAYPLSRSISYTDDDKALAAALQHEETTTTVSTSMTNPLLFNAYAGEKQAWPELREVSVGVWDFKELREQEKADLGDLISARAGEQSKIVVRIRNTGDVLKEGTGTMRFT